MQIISFVWLEQKTAKPLEFTPKTPKKAIFCYVGVKVLWKLINSEFYLAIMVLEIQKYDKKIVTIFTQKFHLCET